MNIIPIAVPCIFYCFVQWPTNVKGKGKAKVKVKVKPSNYRPGQALRVPGCWGS